MSEDIELQILEAKSAALKGELNRARALFRKALKKDPDNLDALISFGVLLNTSRKSAEQGMKYLARAIRLDPSNGLAWAYLGESLILLEQYDKAEDYIRKATKLNPENARNWHRLGNVLEKKNQDDEAIEMIRRSLDIDDTEETTWISLGRVYVKLKQYEEAYDAFYYALKLDPENAYIKDSIGKVENLLSRNES